MELLPELRLYPVRSVMLDWAQWTLVQVWLALLLPLWSVIVDPTNLEDGLHYYEVYGIDSNTPWRGPLFRIPVTITKAMTVKNCPPVVSLRGPAVPSRSHGKLSPLKRYMKTEKVVTFSFPSAKTFSFAVEGCRTIELAIAQIWSSEIGSQETTSVDFEIEFHGVSISNEELMLGGSEAPVNVDVGSLLSSENLVPSASLNKVRIPIRPVESQLRTLATNRDR